MILLTGASGFLGRSIIEVGAGSGIQFRSLGRTATGLDQHVVVDLTNSEVPDQAFAGVETIIHSAGLAHQFGPAGAARENFFKVNADGTERIVMSAVKNQVRHVVLVSSMSVYGPGGDSARIESHPCNPQGHYAESKFAAEQRAIEAVESSSTCLTILRLATLYGDGDQGNVNRLIQAIDRRRFLLIGECKNEKNLLYRTDAAAACLLAAMATEPAHVSTFNVASQPVTMLEVVRGICGHLNQGLPMKVPMAFVAGLNFFSSILGNRGPIGRIQESVTKFTRSDTIDGSAFVKQFSFQPEVSLDEGLRRQVSDYQERKQRS